MQSQLSTSDCQIEHLSAGKRYTLLKRLGKGAYGEVTKAVCNQTGKKVAIKFMDFSNANEAMMRIVCREVKINIFLSSLSCNIFSPRLLDIFFPPGTNEEKPESVTGIYLVFSYYRQNLYDILKLPEYPLNMKQSVVFAYNFLCAMKFIHNCNIIHRDLKPSNILITDNLEVIIADFGFGRCLKNKNPNKIERKLSHRCFTRYYRPPEVILGSNDYDERADIWSIGCILFEVIQKTQSEERP